MKLITPIELLKSRLPGIDPTKPQQDVACPAHPDEHRSLSIGVGDDGRALVKCQAGCPTENVLKKLGLTTADLFARNGRASPPAIRERVQPNPRREMPTWPAHFGTLPLDSVIRAEGITLNAVETARYVYSDAAGNVLFVIVRFGPRDGTGKLIRPFTPSPLGWVPAGFDGVRPLYRLREVLSSTGTVFVCEGEKCVEALRSLGFVATTSAHGASSPDQTDWSPLFGRDVVILPDNDDAGRAYAEHVATLIAEGGAA